MLERERRPVADAVEHLVALQCQEPPAPYTALWSRLDGFDPQDLSAMVADRRAVRLSLLRWTQHLVTARDALTLRPQLQPVIERRMLSAMRRGLGGVDLGELSRAVRELLDERPMLSSELGRALAPRFPQADPQALGIASAAVLPLAQLPPRGQWGRSGRALLTPLDTLLGRPLPRPAPLDDLVRRYLRAFGPASVADMRTWSGLGDLRPVFERLRPRLAVFRDERGRELFDVPGAPLPDADMPAPPRLLPDFDNALLGHDDRSRIVGDLPQRMAADAQPRHVLVDGFLAGTWRVDGKRGRQTISVDLVRRLSRAERTALDEETEGLQAFLRSA